MLFEIYTVGFGDLIRLGLELTSMMFNYVLGSPLVGIAVIIGVGAIAVQSLAKGKLEVTQMVLALALFLVMFVPRVDVTVVDVLGDESSSANGFVIEGVPLGLAASGALTSAAATWMSGLYQTIFVSDGATGPQFTNQQFAFPLRMMMHLRDIEACDLGVTFCRNLATYTRICYKPAQVAGNVNQERIYREPELIFNAEEIGLRGAMPFILENGQTTTRPCSDAGESLNEHLDQVFEEGSGAHGHFSRYLQSRMGDFRGTTTDGDTISVDSGVVRDVALSILGPVAEQRNITVTHIARQVHNAAEAGSFGDDASALWLNQTMERQRLILSVEASGMLRMVLIMMGLMQFLFIVMTPVVAIVALAKLGGGYKLYGSWILLAMWSSSFLITVTVIDFWAQQAVKTRFTDLYTSSAEYSALSVPGLQGAYAAVADILQTAFTFLTAAPIVTLVLLTGSIYPLASLANRLAGGAEASNLAGTQVVADKGAIKTSHEFAAQDNFSGWARTQATSALHGATDIKYSQALDQQHAATQELRASAEQGVTSSLQTAVKDDVTWMQSNLAAGVGSENYDQAFQGMQRWLQTIANDESITDQLSEQQMETFAKYWNAGGSAGKSFGGIFGVSLGAGVRGESSETQTALQSFADRINQNLQAVDDSGASIQEGSRIAEQWTSQESGANSNAWSEVKAHAETYKETTSEIDALSQKLSTSSGVAGSMALNSRTIEAVEDEFRDQGGLSGFLDARLNTYGEDVRQQIVSRGGLPRQDGETSDNNLSAALSLSQMATDRSLPTETRYAASELLGDIFDRVVAGDHAVLGAGDLSEREISSPTDHTGVGDQHLDSGSARALAGAVSDEVGSETDRLRDSALGTEQIQEQSWAGILQTNFNGGRLEELQNLGDEAIESHQEHLTQFASSMVPPGMHKMSVRMFSDFEAAEGAAAKIDEEFNTGSDHVNFVKELERYWGAQGDDAREVMRGFNNDLRNFRGPEHSDALNSPVVKGMVSLGEPTSDSGATAWMWMNGGLDKQSLLAAPDRIRDQVGWMEQQAEQSELVGEWRNLVSSGSSGEGGVEAVRSGGEITQRDMAQYAFSSLSDPRFPEPVHAGLVHEAIARHGDFSSEEIARISQIESANDGEYPSTQGTEELLRILDIERTNIPFGDAHVRVESALHPRVVSQLATEAGAKHDTPNERGPSYRGL